MIYLLFGLRQWSRCRWVSPLILWLERTEQARAELHGWAVTVRD